MEIIVDLSEADEEDDGAPWIDENLRIRGNVEEILPEEYM